MIPTKIFIHFICSFTLHYYIYAISYDILNYCILCFFFNHVTIKKDNIWLNSTFFFPLFEKKCPPHFDTAYEVSKRDIWTLTLQVINKYNSKNNKSFNSARTNKDGTVPCRFYKHGTEPVPCAEPFGSEYSPCFLRRYIFFYVMNERRSFLLVIEESGT